MTLAKVLPQVKSSLGPYGKGSRIPLPGIAKCRGADALTEDSMVRRACGAHEAHPCLILAQRNRRKYVEQLVSRGQRDGSCR